ncbi:hypothetical protein GS432_10010 [Rhodococcus hoagii]|nr:hypothetical protein [Prescottella equi]
MSGRRRRGPAIVLAAALGTSLTVGAHTAQARPPDVDKVPVRLMAINDLHGSLQPPQGARAQILRPDGPPVDAGGGRVPHRVHSAAARAGAELAALLGGRQLGILPHRIRTVSR